MAMKKHFGDVLRPVFNEIERLTLSRQEQGNVVEEDDITGVILNTMEIALNGFNFPNISGPAIPGLYIQTRKLQGRGSGSAESVVGADGAVALHVQFGTFTINKYYLFQAKRFPPTRTFNVGAIKQKWRMLFWTPDSFFAVYTPSSVRYISAFMVDRGDRPSALPSKSFSEFHVDFFNCFIGDHFWSFPPFWNPRKPNSFADENIPARDILSIFISVENQ